MLVGVLPGAAGATGDDDGEHNPTCAELVGGRGISEFKIEAEEGEEVPADGTYTDEATGFEVTIQIVVEGDTALLSFEANTPVKAVFIKAGRGGELYEFDEATTSASDLASPKDSISHISFCFCKDKSSTTSSSTTSSSTTSSSTTSSTTSSSTTSSSTSSTTSTSVEDTTSSSLAAPSSAPPTQPPSEGGGLPITGSNTGLMVGIGSGLLIAGALLVWSTHQRRTRGAHAA